MKKVVVFVKNAPPRHNMDIENKASELAKGLNVLPFVGYVGTPYWNRYLRRCLENKIPLVALGRQVSLRLTEHRIPHIQFIDISSANSKLSDLEYVDQALQDLNKTLEEYNASDSRENI
jgi:hypothetical protein